MDNDSWQRYQIAAQFYTHEMRTLGERTNAFLVVQSILSGGFVLLITKSCNTCHLWWLALGLAVLGLLYCILHFSSGRSAATAADFWRAYMRRLEQQKEGYPWKELCRWYGYYETEERHQFLEEKAPKQEPHVYERRFLDEKPGPGSWFLSPLLFFVAWCVGLIWLFWHCYSLICLTTFVLIILILVVINIYWWWTAKKHVCFIFSLLSKCTVRAS